MTRIDQADGGEQRDLDVVNRRANRFRAVVPAAERHRRRQLLAHRGQQRLDAIDHLDDVGARLLADRDQHAALVHLPRRRLVVLDAVEYVGHLVEPHRVAVAVGDDRRAVRGRAHQLAVRLDDERLVAVDRARRHVRVRVGDGRRDLVDADGPRRELAGIQVDADRELLRAEDVDLRDAVEHRQPLGDRLLRVLVDHRQRQRGRPQDEEDDRLVARVRLLIRGRRRHLRRQRARRPPDHRLDVLRGRVDVPAEVELQRDVGRALLADRIDVGQAGNARELLLERQRHRRRHRFRAGAGEARLHLDGREIHGRQVRHRQRTVRHRAEHQNAQHDERRRDGAFDEEL